MESNATVHLTTHHCVLSTPDRSIAGLTLSPAPSPLPSVTLRLPCRPPPPCPQDAPRHGCRPTGLSPFRRPRRGRRIATAATAAAASALLIPARGANSGGSHKRIGADSPYKIINSFSRKTVIRPSFPQMFIARGPAVRFGQSKVRSTWVYVLRTHIPSFGVSL